LQDKIEEYEHAFKVFDKEGDGILTAEKLGRVLNTDFGQNYDKSELTYMLRQFAPENMPGVWSC
jgi:Ca2+-binding EF-hand superfamily protein